MPMHDWTRVDGNIHHHFHGRWLFAMSDALNQGALPKGFYALADQVIRTIGPDVVTLHAPPANGNGHPRETGSGGVAVALAPPKARVEARAAKRPLERGQRRLTIRHSSGHRVVAVIELVSPANKGSTAGFNSFLGKACALLNEGVHLLVIDPFPPTARDPHGIHAAIWEELTGEPFEPPAGQPLTLASYRAGDEVCAYVDPIAVGETVPDKPLFLDAGVFVNVPLEATYATAWQSFPAEWRAVLEPA